MDWALAGVIVAAITASVVVLTFWLNLSDRISKATASAEAAHSTAKEASIRAESIGAELARFREQVAREYVSHEALRQLEDRLVGAIERLGDRMDKLFEPRSPRERSRSGDVNT